jgi:antitoxin (DNA-binding transcriptional repressor) of toxin-antitoxin stability system
MNNLHKDTIEHQTAALFGLKKETMGKTKVRKEFLPLVAELPHGSKTVEITDRDKPVAVLISYTHWSAIISKLTLLMNPTVTIPTIDLIGSVLFIGNPDTAHKKSTNRFKKAIKKSGRKLQDDWQ